MSSFYGNISITGNSSEIDSSTIQELKNHIIISKTQPTVQKAGDLWFVITSDNQENNDG